MGGLPLHDKAVRPGPAVHDRASQPRISIDRQAVRLRGLQGEGMHHPAGPADNDLLAQHPHGGFFSQHVHLPPVAQGLGGKETGHDLFISLGHSPGRDLEEALMEPGEGDLPVFAVGAAPDRPKGGAFGAAPDIPGHLLGDHPGQDPVLQLPGGLDGVRLAGEPGADQGMGPVFQLVVLQKVAEGPGGNDKARRHRQVQALADLPQVGGLASA